MRGFSREEAKLRKQLIKKIEKGVKDFKNGNIKPHEEVFSKFKEPIDIDKLSNEEFNNMMEKSIEEYEDGNFVSEKEFNKILTKKYK